MRLNLGCGSNILEGWVNIDNRSFDVRVLNLDLSEPLPFPDNSCVQIRAFHILEHISNWPDLLKECHRVLVPHGLIVIRVPYGMNGHPYHVRFFFEDSMDFFIVDGHCRNEDMACTSLEYPDDQLFDLVEKRFTRGSNFPFAWHLKKYLRIPLLFGWNTEITWIMRKHGAKS